MTQLKDVQSQINDVTLIMKQNVEKVLERGDNIDKLEDQSILLKNNSERFQITSRKLKNKLWWKNTKVMIILCTIIFILILIMSLIIWSSVK